MVSGRFLAIFCLSTLIYFILDYALSNGMLYIVGGVVGGSIQEAFRAIGIKAGTVLISLLWIGLLIMVVLLFYRSSSSIVKYVLIFLIGALLYVIDTIATNIPFSESTDIDRIKVISNITVGILILIKSAIISWLIWTGFDKN